jgi:Uma2 family endonuclease
MGQAQPQSPTHFESFDDFLAFENLSDIRYEYYKGEIFAMAGTSLAHNELVGNVWALLRAKFLPRGCKVFSESVKLEAIRNDYYPYPDIMLTCNPFDKREKYIVRNPSLIVEVLSPSTEMHDRTFKWEQYQTIPTLQYYVLVSQKQICVEVFSRTERKDVWLYRMYHNLADEIVFDALDFTISLQVIYENITLLPSVDDLQLKQ